MTFKLNQLKYKIHSTYSLSNNECLESFQRFVDKLKIKTERTYTTISSISSKNKSSKSNITIKANTVSNTIEAKNRPISIKNYRSVDVKKKESFVNKSYQGYKKNNLSLRDYVTKGAQKKKHRRNHSSSHLKKKDNMNYDKCKYKNITRYRL